MGLEKVGIEYTGAGLDPFLKGMNQASQGGQALGAALSGQAVPGLEMIIAKGAAMGSIITGAFNSAIGAVTNFYNSGIQAVTMLQDVELNLQSLAARQIITAGTTDDMNEALEQAAPIAANLMTELKNLSIASPFRYQEILGVYQMNVAFGISTETAMDLTRAITNLGSISKNIPGVMNRLAYNFSQMSMVGQITQRDIRDLAMAGLDLAKVFKLTLGKSVKEVNEDLKSGKIQFQQVAQAVVDYTDKYVGPAAERAARTLGGLGSTLADITFFMAGDIFKDAAQVVTNALGAILDVGMLIINSKIFKTIGVTLAALVSPIEKVTKKFEAMADAYEAAAKVLSGETKFPSFEEARDARRDALKDPLYVFIEGLNDGAEKVANIIADAFGWGLNLVSEFALGMVEGITTSLTWALDTMSGFLEWMMAPGSPPKFLPDIDAWGAGAFTAYLEGFSDADFSVLDQIQNTLKTALGLSLGGDNKAVSALMVDFSKDIAAVLAGAMSKEDLLAEVLENTKMFGSEIAELVGRQLDLAAATEAVRKAEESLKKLRDQERTQTADLNEKMQEYNKMRAAGASPEVLRAKMAEIQAARQGLLSTKKEAATAEKTLETSKQGIDALTERVKQQENLVKQLTELAQLQAQAQAKAAGGAGAGGGGDDGETPPGAGPLDTLIENFKKKIEEKFKGIWDPVVTRWNETIGAKITDLQTAWDTFSANFSTWFTERIQPKLDDFTKWTEDVGLKTFFDELPKNLGVVVGNLILFGSVLALAAIAGGLLSAAVGALFSPIGLLIVALAGLKTAWDLDFMGMQETVLNWQYATEMALRQNEKDTYEWSHKNEVMLTDTINNLQMNLYNMGIGIENFFIGLMDVFYSLAQGVVYVANQALTAINAILTAAGQKAIPLLKDVERYQAPARQYGPPEPWATARPYDPPTWAPPPMGEPGDWGTSTPAPAGSYSPPGSATPGVNSSAYNGTTYNVNINNSYAPGAQPRNPSQDMQAWQVYNNLQTMLSRSSGTP